MAPPRGVVGEGFGGIFTGTATDPNTGPLLVLLGFAVYPVATARARARVRRQARGRALPRHAGILGS
jgi:hypothetical protein